MICSVGGSPEPIIYSLKTIKPAEVIFYCSPSTNYLVTEILRECNFIKTHFIVETINWEDIDINLCFLYDELSAILKRRGIEWNEVLVDYTGGTKTMSAALVLATVDKGVRYAYVSGEERSKEGVGIVIDGTEKMLLKSNPWNTIAYTQRKEIVISFNHGHYDEAIKLAKHSADKLSDNNHWKFIFQELVYIFEGYKQWDCFRHKDALKNINRGIANLQPYSFNEEKLANFLDKVRDNIAFLNQYNTKEKEKNYHFFIKDLLANAYRRGYWEQKYDDAIARCYRTIELIGQSVLIEEYGINPSNCDITKIPEELRDSFLNRYNDEDSNSIKFGLDACYQLLYALNSSLGRFYKDNEFEIRRFLGLRNNSILAHGLQASSEKGFQEIFNFTLKLANLKIEDLNQFPKLEL